MRRLSSGILMTVIVLVFLNPYAPHSSVGLTKEVEESEGSPHGTFLEEGEFQKYEEPVPPPMPNLFSAGLRVITSLLIILTFVFGTLFVLRKLMKGGKFIGERPINVLFQTSVGHRKSICLVEVADRILVLGVTGEQISLLFIIEDIEALYQNGAMEARNASRVTRNGFTETPGRIKGAVLKLFQQKSAD